MANRYQNTLSPIRIGSRLLKSRFLVTRSVSGAFQGDENYPGEAMITHMAELARSGAAIVTCQGADWKADPYFGGGEGGMGPGPGGPMGPDTWGIGSFAGPGMGNLEAETRGCKLYYSHMTDEIHFYGSLASASMMGIEPRNLVLSEVKDSRPPMGPPMKTRVASTEDLDHLVELLAQKANAFRQMGFDMVSFYMSYGNSLLAKSLSPVHNQRTDRYGEKTALTRAVFARTKELCGKDFLIEAQVSAEELAGYTVEDFIRYARNWEGLVDILQLRAPDMDLAHPTGLNSRPDAEPLTLQHARALKRSGIRIAIAPNGGFQNLDDIERWIADGDMDLAAEARAFICDPEYGKKALEGRGEDVVPCLRCNRCHCRDNVICYVNPRMGLEHKLERMLPASTTPKRVAVIGGGPAGMWAAMECRRRGHTVDLYEKTGALGGQMLHARYADFKWPVLRFCNYLIGQLERLGVSVQLNTEPSPEALEAQGYDAVIAAVGAVPAKPPVAGAEDPGIWTPLQVFGAEQQLGAHVIVVGGSETGTETALYLARAGHRVTVLTRRDRLATDAQFSHYYGSLMEAIHGEKQLQTICSVQTTAVTPNSVTYLDKNGTEQTLTADSVVACGGMTPLQEEAIRYSTAGGRFFAIGDCSRVGNIHTCTRGAFSAAMQI